MDEVIVWYNIELLTLINYNYLSEENANMSNEFDRSLFNFIFLTFVLLNGEGSTDF